MLRHAIRRKYLLLFLLAAALLAAAAYSLLLGGQYQTSARIEIQPASEAGDGTGQFYQRQYTLLQSRYLADRVVAAEGLAQDDRFSAVFAIDPARASQAALASIIHATIAIEPVAQSQLVDIVSTTPNPEYSALLANAWAQQFIADNHEKRFGHVGTQREQLRQQMEEQRLALERAEAALAAYANERDIVLIDSAASVAQEGVANDLASAQLSTLNQAVIDASLRRIAARSALGEDRGEVDLDSVTALRNQRAEAARELVALGLPEGTRTARSRALLAEIAALDRQIELADAQVNPLLQADYEQALREEAELRARFDAERESLLAGQGAATEHAILQRDVDSDRELYDALLQRYAELDSRTAGSNNVTLIDRARPPSGPRGFSLPLSLALAAAAAIAAWLALVILLESVSRRRAELEQP